MQLSKCYKSSRRSCFVHSRARRFMTVAAELEPGPEEGHEKSTMEDETSI